jgi:hypothetical protein
LPPQEEEFLLVLVFNVPVDEAVALVILMDDVQSLSVPGAESGSLAVRDVVSKDSEELGSLGLEVDHLFGSIINLLESDFLLSFLVFVHDLVEKLRDEDLDMLLV